MSDHADTIRAALDLLDDICSGEHRDSGLIHETWVNASADLDALAARCDALENALREIEALDSDGGLYDVVWDGVRQWVPKFKVIARAALPAAGTTRAIGSESQREGTPVAGREGEAANSAQLAPPAIPPAGERQET
jgi:hypothetical protein